MVQRHSEKKLSERDLSWEVNSCCSRVKKERKGKMKRTLDVEIEWIEGDESGGEVTLGYRQSNSPGGVKHTGELERFALRRIRHLVLW